MERTRRAEREREREGDRERETETETPKRARERERGRERETKRAHTQRNSCETFGNFAPELEGSGSRLFTGVKSQRHAENEAEIEHCHARNWNAEQN